jgi:hypothetical protein
MYMRASTLTMEAPPSSTTSCTTAYTHESHPRTQLECYLTHITTIRSSSPISGKCSPRSIIFQQSLFFLFKNRNTIDSKNQSNKLDTCDLIARRQKTTPNHKCHTNLASYKALLTSIQSYSPYRILLLPQPYSLCWIDKSTATKNLQIPPNTKHLQKSSNHHKTTSIDTQPSLNSKLPTNTCNIWNQQAQKSPIQKLVLTNSLQNCVHKASKNQETAAPKHHCSTYTLRQGQPTQYQTISEKPKSKVNNTQAR